MIKTKEGQTEMCGTFTEISTDLACIISSVNAKFKDLIGTEEGTKLWIMAIIAAGFDDELKPDSTYDLTDLNNFLNRLGEDEDENFDSL